MRYFPKSNMAVENLSAGTADSIEVTKGLFFTFEGQSLSNALPCYKQNTLAQLAVYWFYVNRQMRKRRTAPAK